VACFQLQHWPPISSITLSLWWDYRGMFSATTLAADCFDYFIPVVGLPWHVFSYNIGRRLIFDYFIPVVGLPWHVFSYNIGRRLIFDYFIPVVGRVRW
jgi:hypothetical protein